MTFREAHRFHDHVFFIASNSETGNLFRNVKSRQAFMKRVLTLKLLEITPVTRFSHIPQLQENRDLGLLDINIIRFSQQKIYTSGP